MSGNKKYLIQDYMQSKVVTAKEDATVRDAVEIMYRKKANGLVVVNDENKPIGILSTWDVIQYIVPDYLEEDKHLATFEPQNLFAERTLQIQNDPINTIMSSPVHTCKATHSIIEAATLLSEFHIRQLPIVDDEGALVGYISRTNIKHAIADVLGL